VRYKDYTDCTVLPTVDERVRCGSAADWSDKYARLNPTLKAATAADEGRTFFISRWESSQPVNAPGPWRGLFASNVGMADDVRIYNTYNPAIGHSVSTRAAESC